MITRRIFLSLRDGPVPDASHAIERDGFVCVPNLLDPDEVESLRRDVERVYDEVPADVRNPQLPAAERESYRYAILNHSEPCRRLVADRRLLDILEPLLGEDCHVIANTAWRNRPSPVHLHPGGHWHIDAGPHVPRPPGVEWDDRIPYPIFAVAVHVMLRDCPAASGPTGFLAGSHRSGQHPPGDRSSDPDLTWEGRSAVTVEAKAGDAVLFASDTWHRRMPSLAGDEGRFFVQIHYGRRDLAQRLLPTAEVNHLSPALDPSGLSERERTVLGLHRPFFYDG